ncbi:hypothetical protein [Sorangium sp. So ce1151]|uniref:hypothetical protein n=1 Tax=Sorangium sp. So ce1151 TaxID=3133332 RepID=UPI003F628575
MARSFTSQDLVALPRLNAAEAVVLATELITVAEARERQVKPKKLPDAIGRSRGRLAAAVAALEALTRPQGGDPVETKTKPKADRIIDNAWSATLALDQDTSWSLAERARGGPGRAVVAGEPGRDGASGPGWGGDSIGLAYLDEDQLTVEGVTFELGPPGKGGVSWDQDGNMVLGEDGVAVEKLRFPE